MENNYLNDKIKVYPNPASNSFAISTEDETVSGKSVLSISDLTGREVKQIIINDLNNSLQRIDVSDLVQGVYLLSLSNNNALVYTGKLVKSD